MNSSNATLEARAALPGGAAPVRLAIEGMTCASCVGRVEKALKKVPGVQAAEVNLATQTAEVRTAGAGLDPAALTAAVEKAGYAAHVIRASSPADAAPRSGQGNPWWP